MWCQFKTAYICDVHSKLSDLVSNGDNKVWEIFDNSKWNMPKGWSLKATGISGASGFYLEFECDDLPDKTDLKIIEKIIEEYNNEV